jgi:hypothetical protein
MRGIAGSFNKNLLSKCFQKLCYLNSYLFYEANIDSYITKSKLNDVEKSKIEFFTQWSCVLLEIGIKNNLYDKYLIDPFILLLRVQISHKFKIQKQVKLFGQYNFDDVFKKTETNQIVLESYYYILANLSEHINYLLRNFQADVAFKGERINNTYKSYQIYKIFFTNFNEVEERGKPSDSYSLFYKPEFKLKDNSYYILRFNNSISNASFIANISGK